MLDPFSFFLNLKRIIGIVLILVGALLVRGLDWMSDASIYIGVLMVAIGLWLALTKNSRNTESKYVGGGVDYDDIADD